MKNYEPEKSFGTRAAERDVSMTRGDEADTVRFLAALAGHGKALEFASGTGRIAIPLQETGVAVAGVELSEAMTTQLHERPGGRVVEVSTGDMSTLRVDGTFSLVYLVFNSLFNLLDQSDQIRCFENAQRHLEPDGAFVVEAFNPSYLHRLDGNQYVKTRGIEMDMVQVEAVRHDPVAQTTEGNHMRLSSNGIEMNPIVLGYAWPSELDLMARIAGLDLEHRTDRRFPSGVVRVCDWCYASDPLYYGGVESYNARPLEV